MNEEIKLGIAFSKLKNVLLAKKMKLDAKLATFLLETISIKLIIWMLSGLIIVLKASAYFMRRQHLVGFRKQLRIKRIHFKMKDFKVCHSSSFSHGNCHEISKVPPLEPLQMIARAYACV